MPDPHKRFLSSASPEQTGLIARHLARHLQAGDVVLLSGDIGAGKTHFARHLIQALLLAPEDVPSPTYTLVQTYCGKSGEIWHADLYRLSDTGEVFELGLIDAFTHSICLVEWPDRLGDLAPRNALHLTLTPQHDADARRLAFEWQNAGWAARLEDALDD